MHLLTEKLANWLRSDSQANHLFATSSGISSSQVSLIRQRLWTIVFARRMNGDRNPRGSYTELTTERIPRLGMGMLFT